MFFKLIGVSIVVVIMVIGTHWLVSNITLKHNQKKKRK